MFARNVRARDHGVVPPPPVPTGPGSGSDLLETKTTVCLLDNTVLKAGSILPSRTTHWADLRQVIEVGLTCLSLSRRHLRTDDYTNRHGEKVQENMVVHQCRFPVCIYKSLTDDTKKSKNVNNGTGVLIGAGRSRTTLSRLSLVIAGMLYYTVCA